MMTCRDCNKPARYAFHCDEHYRCADCGERENRALCTYTEGVLCRPCKDVRTARRIAAFSGDTDFTHEAICPHCGYQHSDSFEMSEGERECGDCGLTFELERDVSVTYSTRKA